MGTLRRIVAVAGLGLAALMLIAQPAHADQISDENTFVARINELRASQGVGQLSVDPRLTDIARSWASQMASTGVLEHNPNFSQQAPGGWRLIGENVGVGASAESLHDAFVASPHHYENLVDPRYTSIGVGVVMVGNTMWVAEQFMAAGGAPAAAAAPAKAPAVKAKKATKKKAAKKRAAKAKVRRKTRARR